MKLTTDRIVDAGMAIFAEAGYRGLSMRQVAERLNVHAGSLYYHVHNKAVLLHLMADRVARQAFDEGTAALAQLPDDAGWPDRIRIQAVTLRNSMLRHPGGAILLAESPKTLSTGALSLMERLLETLRDAGVPAGHQGIAADTLLSHVTGFVLQEQGDSDPPDVAAMDIAVLRELFPLTFTEAPRYEQGDKFLRSIELMCAAIETLIE